MEKGNDPLPRLFEAQYADFDEDIPMWLSFAQDHGGPILELGCGPGRLVFALAAEGYSIVGVDNSSAMLARARSHLTLDLVPRVKLIEADLSDFSLDYHFPLAILACNTFAQQNDSLAISALTTIRSHLEPGGRLALDLPNPSMSLDHLNEDEPMDSFIEPESDHAVQVFARQTWDEEEKVARVIWLYDELSQDGLVSRHEVQMQFQLRTQDEMRGLLTTAGFGDIKFYGDYQFNPLDEDSIRMVVSAGVD